MIAIQVMFEDGNYILTDINATFEEASEYYVGKFFQFGDTDEHPADKMVKCVAIKELKEN
jgi:hypothetical protein